MPIATVAKVVVTKQGLLDLWAAAKVASAGVGPWSLATMHLYKNNVDPNSNTLDTDLGEVQVADWAEYLAIATTAWGAPETRSDGSVLSVAAPIGSWTGPAAGGGPSVYGVFLRSPLAGTHMLAIMPFLAAVGMVDATKVLDVLVPMLLAGGPFVI